jgi:beta-fructofuranosidase
MSNSISTNSILERMALNYHLMHPGLDSSPGDPNAAFCIDGVYHLHYILQRTKDEQHYSFVHVTSPDMLHWTWQATKLQPAFTGHGMYSGTGFVTREGKPAIIYHGQGSDRNFIVLAKDNRLSEWEKPYAIDPKFVDEDISEIHHWDPDCFQIDDTYYSVYGGRYQPLFRSTDLKEWTYVGNFLKHDMSDVAIGEDISCPNFFQLGDKWILLCISHPFGCRYYIGEWDTENEQFVPETHGRMNWRRPEQSIYDTVYRDFFAPESILTSDGRRVMWAWLHALHDDIKYRTCQSLPRELSLDDDGNLRMRPLRELENLRYDPIVLQDINVIPPDAPHSNFAIQHIIDLNGDAFEIQLTIKQSEVRRKRFGLQLFADDNHDGFPIMILPENGTVLVGKTEAPFAVSDLNADEDLELRIFIDRYLVEVFINDRQAAVGIDMDYQLAQGLNIYSYGDSIMIQQIVIWQLRPCNQGFWEALETMIWNPATD